MAVTPGVGALGRVADEALGDCLDAFPFAVLLIDEDHHVLFANRATREGLHLTAAALAGAPCQLIVHGLADPIAGCPLEESLRTGAAVERELFDESRKQWLAAAIYPTAIVSRAGRRVDEQAVYGQCRRPGSCPVACALLVWRAAAAGAPFTPPAARAPRSGPCG